MPPRRFTDDQIIEMRERYAAGGVTYSELAAEFGLAVPMLRKILLGENYADVGGPIHAPKRKYKGGRPPFAAALQALGEKATPDDILKLVHEYGRPDATLEDITSAPREIRLSEGAAARLAAAAERLSDDEDDEDES